MSTVYDEKLLDKVGLAMVPSGYTNNVVDIDNANGALGKVYSVLPEQTIGDNIIENSTFDDTSFWNTGANWSIGGGVATSSGGFSSLSKGSLLEVGKTYRCTFEITSYTSGYVQIVGGTAYYGQFNSEETHTVDIKVSGTETFYVYSNNFIGSVDNVKLQLISDGDFDFSRGSDATRVNKDGYIESVQVLSDELVQNGDFEEIGSELVTNGGFDTDLSGWIGYSNTLVSWQTGGYVVLNNDNNYWCKIQQGNVFEVGKVYKITMTAKSSLANYNFHGSIFAEQSFSEVDTFQTFTQYWTATSTTFTVGFHNVASYGEVTITIDNVSVKEVGQNWIFGTGWSITDDGGNLKVEGNNPSSTQYAYQQNVYTPGDKIRIQFDVSNFTNGQLQVVGGGIIWSTPIITAENGTFSYDIDTTGASNNHIFFRSPNATFDGTIDNVSVKQITDDTDIPRLDYTNSACPSLLLEPQRRNDIINSEDFTSYLSNASQQANSSTSPSNETNATNIYPSSNGIARGLSTSITGTSGVDYTISVFVKSNGKNFVYCTNVNNSSYDVWFDLSNGTISGTGSSNATITNYTNDWYRIAYTSTSTSTTIWSRFLLSDSDGSTSVSVDGTNGVLFYGLQVEQGSYPTSYIPTNGLLVTRRADECNNAGDSTIFNDSEGVLYWEYQPLSTSETQQLTISDGTSSNTAFITFSSNGSININNVSFAGANDGLGYKKVAARHNNGAYSLFVDGKFIETATNPTMSGLKVMQFGQANLGGSLRPYGRTRSVLFFNEALSDAELEYITSADIDLTIHNYKGSLSKISATYEDVGVKDRLTKLF